MGVTAQERRRLLALVPVEGVYIDAARAKRLWDAVTLPDAERIAYVKGVMRLIDTNHVRKLLPE